MTSPTHSTPEQLIAAEASVISTAMRDRSILVDLASLSPEHFNTPGVGSAWGAILVDRTIKEPIALTIGFPEIPEAFVRKVENSNHSRDTVLRARQVLVNHHARSSLRNAAKSILAMADSSDAAGSDLISRARSMINSVSMTCLESTSAHSVAQDLMTDDPKAFIQTRLRALDYTLYGGLHIGQLTGLLARYKVGKTVLMATIARNLEHQGIATLVISLERRKHDIERFIASRALGIDARDFDPKTDSNQEAAFRHYLQDKRTLRYIHKPGITSEELRSTIISQVQLHKIKVVLVDYWQLITNPSGKQSREEKQAEAGQMLADLAADLDIAIAVTGQLNQEGTPKGSEGILAAAGMVVKINRPENGDEGFIQTMVSNKGKPLDKGSPAQPSIELVLPGPHFRDIV